MSNNHLYKKWQFFVRYFFLLTCIVFSSCSPKHQVAVYERPTISSQQETERLGGSRIQIIKAGDTLYSIAFANGLNVNSLAVWNGVTDTSKLTIGQHIRLTIPNTLLTTKSSSQNKYSYRSKYIKPSDQANKTLPAKQTFIAKWRWPTAGKVTRLFSPNLGQQGINVQGNFGQSVYTTSAGEVVYVGNGLKGYGNLIIIKHSEQFLSAYAHNQKTFVTEGQIVVARSRIATMGKDKNNATALHFQIRKDGQPVNPLIYLPKR